MTQQTAVDFIKEQLSKNEDIRWRGSDIDSIYKQAKQMEKEQTVISDEEIEKLADEFALKYYTSGVTEDEVSAFVTGMKWYREQLKKK